MIMSSMPMEMPATWSPSEAELLHAIERVDRGLWPATW
jgi:hypothetical protein